MVAAGNSFVEGRVDMAARPGHLNEYTVTTYNADGIESGTSHVATASIQGLKGFLPLVKAR